jgi:hypothetical protein
MYGNERVLLADPTEARSLRAADGVVAAGGEAIVVTSVAAAKNVQGVFDRGVFAFDLPDGSGIVLAAEMLLDQRIENIAFACFDDGTGADEEPAGVDDDGVE